MLPVEIHIKEHIDEHWSDWLAGFRVVHTEGGETVLTGSLRDQAALRGLLDRIADLGLQLSLVKTLEPRARNTGVGGARMKSSWKGLLLVAVVAVVITAAVTVAVAWQGGAVEQTALPQGEIKLSGTFESIGTVGDRNPKVDGAKLVMHSVRYGQVHGSLEGVDRAETTVTIDTQTGAMTFDGMGFFTGTLNGVAGTAVTKLSGAGQFMYPSGLSYTVHGVSTLVGGTGGLANVSGSMSFDQQVTGGVEGPVPYSGSAQVK